MLLASSKHPVYFERSLESSDGGSVWRRGRIHAAYLSVEWSGEEAYLTAIEEFLLLQQQRFLFHSLAAELRKRELMTVDDRQPVRLRVSVSVTDLRCPSARPLPPLPRFSDRGAPSQ